jgi:non-ribosomal peptide synthase protein (TIGR01720 family)
MEGHGRDPIFEDLDVSRTVGWFTTIYPVLLELQSSDKPGDILKSVKEQLRRVPAQGLGYGLLRYLSVDDEIGGSLRALPSAEISFLYLGQTDQGPADSTIHERPLESPGLTQSPTSHRPHLLQINGSVAGHRLRMNWAYSHEVHRRDTIEALAAGFIESLCSLISHCLSPEAGGYTPSDLPEAGLTQSELDKVLAHIGESDD